MVRAGELADTSIGLSWAHPANMGSAFEVGFLMAEGCVEGACTDHQKNNGSWSDWDWSGANVELVAGSAHHGAALTGLEPGRTYFVSARLAGGFASDPVPFRTKKTNLMCGNFDMISDHWEVVC